MVATTPNDRAQREARARRYLAPYLGELVRDGKLPLVDAGRRTIVAAQLVENVLADFTVLLDAEGSAATT